MKWFFKRKDGGADSPVTAYFLVEAKGGFSVALLHFPRGSRENFHSHAFASLSLLLWGLLYEEYPGGAPADVHRAGEAIVTRRSPLHRVWGLAESSWAFTVRGPWSKTWVEYNEACETVTTLSNGRVVQGQRKL